MKKCFNHISGTNFSRLIIFILCIIMTTVFFAGCANNKTNTNPQDASNTSHIENTDLAITPVQSEDINYGRLEIRTKGVYVITPDPLMYVTDPDYIQSMWNLMNKDSWTVLEDNFKINAGEIGSSLRLVFFNGLNYYHKEKDNMSNYPIYSFYDNDYVEMHSAGIENQTITKYKMPDGTFQKMFDYIKNAGLKGVEYLNLIEVIVRLVNNNGILWAIEEGKEPFNLSSLMSGDDNRELFYASLSLVTNLPGGADTWKFIPDMKNEPAQNPTIVFKNDWYTLSLYSGIASIKLNTIDNATGKYPTCWYSTPDNVLDDTMNLLSKWK